MLLILDEAQTLEAERSPEHNEMVTEVLNAIHNGRMGQPVILLAAGLGRTKEVFRTLGISRFDSSTFVELGALEKEAEVAVIRDWLTKEGGAVGDPNPWIRAISHQTFRWPQHIVSFIKPALKHLGKTNGAMTEEGLSTILRIGCQKRSEYYEHKASGMDVEARCSLARSFANIPVGGTQKATQIIESLMWDFGQDEARELFRSAERMGILSSVAGEYVVPIPSMQNWLVSNYATELEKKAPSGVPDREQEQSTKGLSPRGRKTISFNEVQIPPPKAWQPPTHPYISEMWVRGESDK